MPIRVQIPLFLPAGKPGRLHGKIDGPFDVTGSVLPLLAGVHQKQALPVLAVAFPQVVGGYEPVAAVIRLGHDIVPGRFLWSYRPIV
jgi:hypothetical protein